ncbi:MAG: hypothetical protein RL160_1949 [Bacteroidota bacterium]
MFAIDGSNIIQSNLKAFTGVWLFKNQGIAITLYPICGFNVPMNILELIHLYFLRLQT